VLPVDLKRDPLATTTLARRRRPRRPTIPLVPSTAPSEIDHALLLYLTAISPQVDNVGRPKPTEATVPYARRTILRWQGELPREGLSSERKRGWGDHISSV
jgi:hypothetical protein